MRILLDQSGYDLLNIGDVAMLQSCVARLRQQWPGAEIMVIAHAPERLASYCPGTWAIGRTFADLPVLRVVPRRPRLASEQAWKAAAPYLNGLGRRGRRPRTAPLRHPRTAVQAVRAADIVVASGGGYVTDTWWWHAAGVLSLLAMAQRLGKPTAMFGQGIGPIGLRGLRAQARAVFPGLAVLGLREARTGAGLALSLGAPPAAVRVTGDDALEIATGTDVADGDALGVNIRVAGYAGTDGAAVAAIGALLKDMAASFHAPITGLPVSRYEPGTDLAAIRSLLGEDGGPRDAALSDLTSPGELATAVAGCRAVVTGSYHAAVFALARGIPVVCLTKSPYYDAKFAGLRVLFPSACSVVSLAGPDLAGRLRSAIDQSWHLPIAGRAAALHAAECQRRAGRDAYRQLRAAVENGTGNGMALAQDKEVIA